MAIAKRWLRFHELADNLEKLDHEGRTWKGVRYERLALPLTPLVDGVTPGGTSMTITPVTGIAEQWGQYVSLTDVGLLTTTHPVLQKANELLGISAAETVDREIQRTLQGATNILYADATAPKTNASRSSIIAEDVIDTLIVQRAVAGLQNNGAMFYDGQYFHGIVNPSVKMDFINDARFNSAATYAAIAQLKAGEIGEWMGVRWITSNFVQRYIHLSAPTAAPNATAGTHTAVAHDVVIVGRNLNTGFEELISATAVVTPVVNQSILVSRAALSAGYVYDIYTGTSAAGARLTAHVGRTAAEMASGVVSSTPGTGVAAPIAPSLAAGTVHNVWIFGKGGFGVTELTNIERTITPAVASDSDPLVQRRKTGWKAFFKAIILNNDFMAKVECASRF